MGGRGSSNPGGNVSAERVAQIKRGIATHSSEQNDRAERNYLRDIQKEKEIVDRKDAYIRTGHIKSANDPWFKDHVNSYNNLKAQLEIFRKERKRQKR